MNHYDVSHLNIFIKSKERKQRKTKERPKKDDTHASSKRKTKKRKTTPTLWQERREERKTTPTLWQERRQEKERRHPRFINCPTSRRAILPCWHQPGRSKLASQERRHPRFINCPTSRRAILPCWHQPGRSKLAICHNPETARSHWTTHPTITVSRGVYDALSCVVRTQELVLTSNTGGSG